MFLFILLFIRINTLLEEKKIKTSNTLCLFLTDNSTKEKQFSVNPFPSQFPYLCSHSKEKCFWKRSLKKFEFNKLEELDVLLWMK